MTLIDSFKPPFGYRNGCYPRQDLYAEDWLAFSDVETIYPRDQWPLLLAAHTGQEQLVRKIKDQGQEGSCASNAATQCLEIAWNLAYGPALWIECSPISIYRFVSNGPSQGSSIDANLRRLRDVGALPVDTPANKAALKHAGLPEAHTLAAVGYHQPFPAGWERTAEHFRAAEWLDLDSFDALVSAVFRGFPVCYGRASHAITAVRVVERNGNYLIRYANSWGDWGDHGYGLDSESAIANAIRSYGAWALRCPHLTDPFLEMKDL